MIKDIQTPSFFIKDGMNDNSSFRWCFCPGDEGGPGDAEAGSGGYGGVADEDIGSGVEDSLSVDEARSAVNAVEAQAISPATQAQLNEQLGMLSARSAAEKAEGLQDLMDMGIYGYNDAVDKGFVDAVDRANQQAEINLAYDIAAKYGLDPSQVQPGFMQDPSLGPQTMSYTGPGSFNAATSEMATAAGMLAANLVDMTPGLFGLARGLAGFGRKDSFAGLVGQARGQSRDEQAESLSSKVQGYMDERAASQREANIAARGETDPSTAGIIDDYEEEVSQQGAFSAPNVADISAPDIAAPSSFDTVDLTGDVPFIPLAEPIPSVPTLAPEPAVEVVRAPVTRRPATDTFGILERIYGPDVAAKLLPTRIV